jgi:hypothetical protein
MDESKMAAYEVCIEIGEMPILVRTASGEFANLLRDRYGPFVVGATRSADPSDGGLATGGRGGCPCPPRPPQGSPLNAVFELEVELVPPGSVTDADDARVRVERGRWVLERGDFRAEWEPNRRRGWVRQSPNPYSIDAVLRILHSLILAREGGFLVHAASAIRNGRAFLFAGVSGAGKTTISRLAPADVVLLTDEISYVRRREQGTGNSAQGTEESERGTSLVAQDATNQGTDQSESAAPSLFPVPYSLFPAFEAFGTPFAGELARIGENLRAPVAALYLLVQGAENRFEAVSQAEAARALLQNILFFAQDEELVRLVSQSAFDFVSRVPVRRLVFTRDARVWELIE